ncbi:MAG: T9SS type A sorting domain-containing protein, partial [Calditrichaeota bacterium]|nr:T9SS type A sorting domain-containing protein [Calditrichota bacterium]
EKGIAWWENDGEQEFTEHTITDNVYRPTCVYVTDIDEDGDMDVLGSILEIAWWENDGEQDFTEHTIAPDFDGARSVYAADIDGDGDMDVLGASNDEEKGIAWWENDGEQEFTEHTIADDFLDAQSVYAADMDGDGDMDVLGSSAGDEGLHMKWWESDLAGRPALEGFVFDFESDQSLEGAVVATSYGIEAVAGGDGYWQINPVRWTPFNLTASMIGYNDSTLIDVEVEAYDTLEIFFELLHPIITSSVERFSAELNQEESTDIDFSIENEGNGILEWSVIGRLIGESGVDPWELRRSIEAGETVDDARLSGVVFTNDHFYITGNAHDPNLIYILNREGELVSSFPQVGESNYGMRDLAWDGELIWGVTDETVYGFNTEGDSVTSFHGPFDRMVAITWDPDRELLWISGMTTDIHGYDRQGNHDQEDEISRQELRIYGLAYWLEDPDSYQLYILNKSPDDRQLVHKKNLDTGDTLFVSELLPEGGGLPRGAFITKEYDEHSGWVFMNVSSSPDGDRFDIWQLRANNDWIWVEPMDGTLNPGEEQELTLILDTSGLLSMIYEGELIFSMDNVGGETSVPVTLTVQPLEIIDEIKANILTQFQITGIYPNPFNSMAIINYSLPKAASITLKLYDLSGRRIETLLEGRMQAGFHRETVNAANDLPSGLYFVQLKASDQVFTQKVMLIK